MAEVGVNDRQLKQAAFECIMRNGSNQLRFRVVYNTPGCDVQGRIVVRVTLKTAACAMKRVLSAGAELATSGAGLAGPRRVDEFYSESGPLGFVSHKALKLPEAPARDHTIQVSVSDLGSLPNILEMFQTDGSVVVPYGFGNDGFAQNVIFMLDATKLIPGEPSQNPLGSWRSFGLEACADTHPFSLESLSCRSVVKGAVRSRSGISDAQVNTHRRTLAGRIVGVFHDDVDHPALALSHDSCCRRLFARKTLPLERSEQQRDMDASADNRKRDGFVTFPELKNTSVIINRCRPELPGLLPTSPRRRHRSSNPPDGADGEIGGQAKIGTDPAVTELVQPDVVAGILGKRSFQNGITSVGESLAGFQQLGYHYRGRGHLATECTLAHGEHHITRHGNLSRQNTALPLSAEADSLRAGEGS
jgi:hypothetical protein